MVVKWFNRIVLVIGLVLIIRPELLNWLFELGEKGFYP